ncbi:MAG: hypothetical protein RI900_1101 [Actinomycetota bacterium]|jgi:Helix-turn-helix domain
MPSTDTVDVTAPAFALRLANLLVHTRTRNGLSVAAVAKSSGGMFTRHDLKEYERAGRALTEDVIDELAQLYRCDLGAILPLRLPVVVTQNRVIAGGVHEEYSSNDPDALLTAYLMLVRTLRRQKKAPVVDLRRDDIEVLAGFLRDSHENVVHRLANLMHATQAKRTAMVGVLATGAAVVGLVGSAVALEATDASPVSTDTVVTLDTTVDSVADTTIVTDTTAVVVTDPGTTTTVVDTTVPAPTSSEAPPTTLRPVVIVPTIPAPTSTIPSIETNLTTTTTLVDTGEPPIPGG